VVAEPLQLNFRKAYALPTQKLSNEVYKSFSSEWLSASRLSANIHRASERGRRWLSRLKAQPGERRILNRTRKGYKWNFEHFDL
jgi:hypothetical protein